jgi:hypothetical protein
VKRWDVPTAVLAFVGLMVGCSGDDDSPADRADEVPGSAELAEHIGCDEIEPISSGIGADTRQCVIDGQWPVNIHASLTPQERAAGITRLGMRSDPAVAPDLNLPTPRCPDGSRDDPLVVAGGTWIVVVGDEAGAEVLMDRIGGEVQRGEHHGPPISYEVPSGSFCRR